MSNMSYCRFENTLTDLRDCAENITDTVSESEHKARVRLIKECYAIVKEFMDFDGNLRVEEIETLPVDAD